MQKKIGRIWVIANYRSNDRRKECDSLQTDFRSYEPNIAQFQIAMKSPQTIGNHGALHVSRPQPTGCQQIEPSFFRSELPRSSAQYSLEESAGLEIHRVEFLPREVGQ